MQLLRQHIYIYIYNIYVLWVVMGEQWFVICEQWVENKSFYHNNLTEPSEFKHIFSWKKEGNNFSRRLSSNGEIFIGNYQTS